MILTNEEIMRINQTAEFDSAIGYARKIEEAAIEQLQARSAELEAEIEQLKYEQFKRLEREAEKRMELHQQLKAAQEENKLIIMNLTQCGEQFATAEQRVAEWQPISTAPITCNSLLIRRNGEVCIANWGDYDEVNQPKFTHWMPLPKAPANGASS